jgi:ring-1,2-phenylacetyl-CoA epoxidase subunit PaaD
VVSGASLCDRAQAAASRVVDPEIPVLTIADLGVLRAVRLDGDTVEIDITPTYSGCPAMRVIEFEIEAELRRAGIDKFRIATVLSPAWTTDWLTADGRRKLAAFGIAPPAGKTSRRALFSADAVSCPRCGSPETERIAEFGSTSCKALYRCRSCAEPFDYFKCH